MSYLLYLDVFLTVLHCRSIKLHFSLMLLIGIAYAVVTGCYLSCDKKDSYESLSM